MAEWYPCNPDAFLPLVIQLRKDKAANHTFNPPSNDWTAPRKAALRQDLNLPNDEEGNKITNIVISCISACSNENAAAFSVDALIARGWVVSPQAALDRLTKVEADVANIEKTLEAILRRLPPSTV